MEIGQIGGKEDPISSTFWSSSQSAQVNFMGQSASRSISKTGYVVVLLWSLWRFFIFFVCFTDPSRAQPALGPNDQGQVLKELVAPADYEINDEDGQGQMSDVDDGEDAPVNVDIEDEVSANFTMKA